MLLMLFATALHAADFVWKPERFEGRDYVTLQQMAEFYGFTSPLAPVDNVITLESEKAELQVVLGNREVEINGVKHWLAFPVHSMDGQVLVSRLDLAKIIEPSLRPEFIQGLQPVKTVVLDAGHGAEDKGAVSRFGYEKDFALDVCMRARRLLEDRGYHVEMTRTTDVLIPLEERPQVANRIPDSIFVSVHFNASSENGQASGFEVFSITPRGAPSTAEEQLSLGDSAMNRAMRWTCRAARWPTCVYNSLLGNIPQADRGLKNARFAVIRLATVPAILIEGGFLSNNSDSSLVASAAWRTKLAEAIADGIDNYKNLAEHKQRPKTVAADSPHRPGPRHAPRRDGRIGQPSRQRCLRGIDAARRRLFFRKLARFPHALVQAFQIFSPRNFYRPECLEMGREPLHLEHPEIIFPHPLHEPAKRHLRRIGGMVKHRFPEKNRAETHPVQSPRQLPILPRLHGMGIPAPVQFAIASYDVLVDPCLLARGAFAHDLANAVSILISNAPLRRVRFNPCGTWKFSSGMIARGSGENQPISPSSIAIGKIPRQYLEQQVGRDHFRNLLIAGICNGFHVKMKF